MALISRQKQNLKNQSPPEARLFVQGLLKWDSMENKRSMPWKGEKDPYRIWLSEIILQQTRVEQGLKYYEKFITIFPDVRSLAEAPPEKVFKLWEGLGYYSRCRNLIASARFISEELNGIFPSDHASILNLKGVGSYIAAAISSFAYNLPHAVLDGNVFRVLSRICGIETPIDTSAGKKEFSILAQSMLPDGKAAVYNQAIMDFGAVICKPVPLCSQCFFNAHCRAFISGKQDILPVKEKKISVKKRWFTYFITSCKGNVLIHQRTSSDIWKELFEFPVIESDDILRAHDQRELFEKQYGFTYRLVSSFKSEQKLTHQLIHFDLLKVEVNEMRKIADYKWIKISELDQYAFPKTLQKFIAEHVSDRGEVDSK